MNKDNAKDYLPLVQALVDGKTIQWRDSNGQWKDSEHLSCFWDAKEYRIKPEPREIWVNHYKDGAISGPFYTEHDAKTYKMTGAVAIKYREVLE